MMGSTASCNHASATDAAQAAISSASSRVQSAYGEVLGAEEAGANVSTLLSKLNACTSLLSQAYTSYRAGNSTEALSLAEQCNASLRGIEADAESSRDDAVSDSRQKILASSETSAVAIIAIVVLSMLGWRFFKKWSADRFTRLKPEGRADEPR